MKFEKISDEKFNDFKSSEIAFPQSVYGGYTGETSTQTQYDQEKKNGAVDSTNKINDPQTRDDGFKDY
jgi:hypothetical protein